MKEFFNRLNAMERRFVIGVLIVIFLVINILFVWPRFKDWDEMIRRLDKAEKTVASRDLLISQSKTNEIRVRQLESEGEPVPQEDQMNEFLRTITSQAAQSGVNIIANTSIRQTATTNQFFSEQAQAVNVMAGEAQLVDFLYKLGVGNSLIRVRDLSLNPDAPRYQLSANLKLVASFQKKIALRTVAPTTNAPAAKSAAPVKPVVPPAKPPTKK